jgi:anthranilate synthase component 2
VILLLDNFDSFTYNIVDYLGRLGQKVCVLRNDISIEKIQSLDFEAIVLSPGPGSPQNAGVMPRLLAEYAHRKPILGICLGHQAIGCHFGAKISKALRPMHGKISTITHSQKGIFEKIPQNFEVVRYHSLVLSEIPECIEIQAFTQENEVMAISHKDLPIVGLQFHPEAALTQHGLSLLQNWLYRCII